jgi:5'-methylthioadenosine phosphorylase
VFGENIERLRDLLFAVVEALPAQRTCACGSALEGAAFHP